MEIVAASPVSGGRVRVHDIINGFAPNTLFDFEPEPGYAGGLYVAGA